MANTCGVFNIQFSNLELVSIPYLKQFFKKDGVLGTVGRAS